MHYEVPILNVLSTCADLVEAQQTVKRFTVADGPQCYSDGGYDVDE